MSGTSRPQRPPLLQRIVIRGLQRFWRLSRGHSLKAAALVWGPSATLLLSSEGSLPETTVERGQAAREAMAIELRRQFNFEAGSLCLVAVAHTSVPRESAHTVLYELDLSSPGALPAGHAVVSAEALEGIVHPEVLTMIRNRLGLRREAKTG